MYCNSRWNGYLFALWASINSCVFIVHLTLLWRTCLNGKFLSAGMLSSKPTITRMFNYHAIWMTDHKVEVPFFHYLTTAQFWCLMYNCIVDDLSKSQPSGCYWMRVTLVTSIHLYAQTTFFLYNVSQSQLTK